MISRVRSALALAVAVVLVSACVASGRSPQPPAQARRIVSLVPSLTEDLFAIGAGAAVIAVTQADDYPPQVKRLPAVASFSSVNNEGIVRLHPDAVVGIPPQERLTAPLRAGGIATVFFRDDSFEDIFSAISGLGALTGRSHAAQRLIASLHRQTLQLQHGIGARGHEPSVLVVINARPIIVAGKRSFISKMLELGGAKNAAASVPQPYPTLSAEALLREQPDAVVTDDQTQLTAVLDQEPWRSLRAVRARRIFILDKRHTDVFERPGPRYNEGLSWLIDRLRTLP